MQISLQVNWINLSLVIVFGVIVTSCDDDDDDDDVLTAHKHHECCISANLWLVLRPWANHTVYKDIQWKLKKQCKLNGRNQDHNNSLHTEQKLTC